METLRPLDLSPVPDVPLSEVSRAIFHDARRIAGLPDTGKIGTKHLGTEHLMIALLRDSSVAAILRRSSIDPVTLTSELETYLARGDDNVPPTDDEGLTPTVILTINNAKRIAHRVQTRVEPHHLYEGFILAGRSEALKTLGRHLGYFEENTLATPLIQDRLLQHIPHVRPVVE